MKKGAVSQQQPAENDSPAIKNRVNAIDVRALSISHPHVYPLA
jgi:hypothetical protein